MTAKYNCQNPIAKQKKHRWGLEFMGMEREGHKEGKGEGTGHRRRTCRREEEICNGLTGKRMWPGELQSYDAA